MSKPTSGLIYIVNCANQANCAKYNVEYNSEYCKKDKNIS